MASDLLQLILKGIQKGEADTKEKERKKALSNFIQSLDTLTRQETPAEPAPAPSPAPQIPEIAPGAPISLPGGGPFPMGPMSPSTPMPAPGVPPPVTPGGNLERVRRGIFGSLGQAGDYAPEAVNMVHQLFGTKLFGEDQFKAAAPGSSIFSPSSGEIATTAPDRPGKPSFGVSEKGWLTMVHPDGTHEELVGVRPPQIVQEQMKGETARDVARIRGQYQLLSAEERANAQKAVAQIRGIVGDRINSPAKLYTHLTQKWIDGTANEDEIAVLKHLEPVIIKMGGLQMLMQMETGKKMNVAPWEDLPEEQKPPIEARQDYSWWQSLLKGGKPADEGTAPPGVPPPAAKTPTTPSGKPRYTATMTFGNKKYNMEPPGDWSPNQVQDTLKKAEKAIKEKNKDPQAILNILKQYGWKVN